MRPQDLFSIRCENPFGTGDLKYTVYFTNTSHMPKLYSEKKLAMHH